MKSLFVTEASMKCLLIHDLHLTFRRLMLTFQGQASARASSGRKGKKAPFQLRNWLPSGNCHT